MRIFVAINPTAEELARLGAASRRLREAGYPVRWVAEGHVHLTLKFLGEVAEEHVPRLGSSLESALVGTRSFEMGVGGFGAFPSLRRPRVLWAGVSVSDALAALYSQVESTLTGLGHPKEEREFSPHLTLGRAKKGARAAEFAGLEDLTRGLVYEDTYRVSSLEVMRSRLMPGGPLYDAVYSIELG